MFKIKSAVLAVMLAVPGAWALGSLLPNTDAQQVTFASPAQVNTYELMSSSKDLPVKIYDSY
jgi:hypothetical protein